MVAAWCVDFKVKMCIYIATIPNKEIQIKIKHFTIITIGLLFCFIKNAIKPMRKFMAVNIVTTMDVMPATVKKLINSAKNLPKPV